MIESKLSLIDLAGSERASATNNRGARLQEGANINKSLLALANCINALAAGDRPNGKKHNVKYRDSKLTHLLKSSLEGNCNLIVIANINPSHFTYEDSHNTLKYSNRAKNIKVNPVALEQKQESNWMEREAALRSENAFLRSKVLELEAEVKMLRERTHVHSFSDSITTMTSSTHVMSSLSSSSSPPLPTSMNTIVEEPEIDSSNCVDAEPRNTKRDSLDGLATHLSGMDVIDNKIKEELTTSLMRDLESIDDNEKTEEAEIIGASEDIAEVSLFLISLISIKYLLTLLQLQSFRKSLLI